MLKYLHIQIYFRLFFLQESLLLFLLIFHAINVQFWGNWQLNIIEAIVLGTCLSSSWGILKLCSPIYGSCHRTEFAQFCLKFIYLFVYNLSLRTATGIFKKSFSICLLPIHRNALDFSYWLCILPLCLIPYQLYY